jgi:uncharacterized protein with PIN domain
MEKQNILKQKELVCTACGRELTQEEAETRKRDVHKSKEKNNIDIMCLKCNNKYNKFKTAGSQEIFSQIDKNLSTNKAMYNYLKILKDQ